MTLALLVVTGQLADWLAYVLSYRTAVEINPIAAAIRDPGVLLLLKALAALILFAGCLYLVRAGRGRAVAWLSLVGWVGALSGVVAAA